MPFSVLLLLGCILAVLHSYVGYPCWWWFFGSFIPKRKNMEPCSVELPRVAIIVAAYNEAECISKRVKNLLSLDYPSEKLDIYIESDGSDDETVVRARNAAAENARVHVSDHFVRRGKVSVLNDACKRVDSDVLVFSDANVEFSEDVLHKLVLPFLDPMVACVCGKLCFRVAGGSAHSSTEGFYWKLESWLKEQEGSRGVLLGANGAIYAIRRSLWEHCPADTVVEDFYIPMTLLMKGHKVVFESSAIAYEDLPPTLKDEFGRRIRIGAGDFQALARCLPILHPRYGLAAWAFFSRKLLRWFGPFFLLGSLISATTLALGDHFLGYLALIGWAAFIGIAVIGVFAGTKHGFLGKVSGAAAHFASMNLALFFGFFRWLSRSQRVTWQRTAR